MKNIDYVNTVLSKKMDVPVKVIELVNKEYWKEIKKKMNDLESTNLFIRKIGTFSASRYLINQKIKKDINLIRRLPNNKKYSELRKQEIIKKVMGRLKKLLYQRNEVAKIYYERAKRVSSANSESI